RPGGRRARSAVSRSIRKGTSVRGKTGITSTDPADRGREVIDSTATLEVLREGEIELVGRLLGSTNHAMLGRVTRSCPPPEVPVTVEAVYKPTAGERPLDDFPDATLSRREVAAFLVSEAIGWSIVPPTVLRDGPFGEGALQLWIDADPTVDVVGMVVGDDERLRRIAVFDAAVNNTDRKGGHLLPVEGGHIFGVDHGVTFSTVPKLRTVLWGWRGDAFTDDERAGLERLAVALRGDLARELAPLLSRLEIAATRRRVDQLLESGRFPFPRGDWPAVPWPPF
ncbi:MAG TPA: SCO1664 family protein, partial [Candidatus Limnocylindrales bacterium]|nr:SCO1664 family protein [Candidatus Limnocylindrales bacterium]